MSPVYTVYYHVFLSASGYRAYSVLSGIFLGSYKAYATPTSVSVSFRDLRQIFRRASSPSSRNSIKAVVCIEGLH